ncbi:MAG: carbohydrate binding family 9 domain-containing protein [Acidobacteria bacterium]|nr:carbohydrate binding family 9 domain-containing protein [Acidobacteriota bacterium]
MNLLVLAAALVAFAAPSFAQEQAGSSSTVVIDGSPAPVAPETITRDARNRATVRAIKLASPLVMDGKLDDEVYQTNKPFGGFLQVVPKYGVESTERSDVWVTYDEDNIYVSCRCWDEAPPDKWIANELRRDTNQLRQNDHFGVMFDTFYDRRSGFMFYTNVLGALADYSVIDEGQSNTDWNPVWESRTAQFDGGWTVEMAIPFKTLRYRSGLNQVWGIQLRRAIRHKNEWTYLTPVPQNLAGPQALNRVSAAGTLVGLDLPPASKNFEIKPYAISRLSTDRLRATPLNNDFEWDLGGDVKYGVTANLTADFTINTDFAQVEIDEQQVNLTRFSLFFPEKRDFFLEGRGVFDFGRGGAGAQMGATGDTPSLFYSRRIGLNGGRVVPIDVGGRLTGKVGEYGIGIMNIQTGDEVVSRTPDTNFSVIRVKRDILRRSTVGAMFTNRSASSLVSRDGSNQAYGVDASLAFFQNVNIGAYWARTATPGLDADDDSYQGKFDYTADRYGARAEFLKVGDNFNPEVGFVRRDDFKKSYAQLRFSPRPRNIKRVRKFTGEAGTEYVVNGAGDLETREHNARFNTEFENSDGVTIEVTDTYEMLLQAFRPVAGAVVRPGSYSFQTVQASYTMGPQRPVSGTWSISRGGYYGGDITTLGYSGGRVTITKRFSLEPRVSINRVSLPTGEFTTRLYGSRVDYGFSPRMFTSALLQYNSSDRTFSSNLRYRWEYRPGSEFFLVWTDEQDTRGNRFGGIGLRNRAFAVKATRMLRF